MKRQQIQLIALVVVLLAVIGLYFGFRHAGSSEESADAADTSSEVLSIKAKNITSVTASGKVTWALNYSGKKWTFAEGDHEVSSDIADTIAGSLNPLSADQVIGDVTDLSKYGLDDPYLTISVTTKQGKRYTLYFSDYNEMGGCNYFYVDGDTSTVYTCQSSLVSALGPELSSLDKTAADAAATAATAAAADTAAAATN